MGRSQYGKAVKSITVVMAGLILMLGMAMGAQAAVLSLEEAVQRGLSAATSLTLAAFAIEEANIDLEEATIGRLAGQPESQVVAAQAALRDAHGAYIDELVRVALAVEEAYFGVIRSEELLRIQQSRVEQSERQFAVAQARFEAGLISRQDFIEADMSHAQTEQALARSERQLAESRRKLARLMDAADDAVFALDNVFGFEPLEISLADAIDEALLDRSEIKKAERALEQAKLNVAQADNAYTAAVTLRKAQMALRRAEIQLNQTRVQVADSIRTEWYGLQDAAHAVTAARQSEQISKDRLAITTARFDAGLVSLMDLMRDQAQASQAELDAAAAVWDYNLMKARFLRSLGRPELPVLPPHIAEFMASWD